MFSAIITALVLKLKFLIIAIINTVLMDPIKSIFSFKIKIKVNVND